MENTSVRKQLQRIHQLLVNSRWALEHGSGMVHNRWLKNLLFTLACRRVIMLNTLDRELGILSMPLRPGSSARAYFRKLMGNGDGPVKPDTFVKSCEEEEKRMMDELTAMIAQPGLSGSTRQVLTELLSSTRENLSDVRFIKLNLAA